MKVQRLDKEQAALLASWLRIAAARHDGEAKAAAPHETELRFN
jgi:hypothetical protein